MRWPLILLAGCGRWGFFPDPDPEPTSDASSACVQVWGRSTDWIDGGQKNTTAGNPSIVDGRPVWSYEIVTGGGTIEAPDAWYRMSTSPPTLLVWDDSWFVSGVPGWVASDDVAPAVSEFQTLTQPQPARHPMAGLIRWTNPAAHALELHIEGRLVVTWEGQPTVPRIDVDVVIVHFDAAGGVRAVPFAQTIVKPNPAIERESIRVAVTPVTVLVEPGDSIGLSHRGRTTSADGWLDVHDHISLVSTTCP